MLAEWLVEQISVPGFVDGEGKWIRGKGKKFGRRSHVFFPPPGMFPVVYFEPKKLGGTLGIPWTAPSLKPGGDLEVRDGAGL